MTTTVPTEEVVDRVRETVLSRRAADHLQAYFHGSTVDRRGPPGPAAGRWFDRLGGGGDRAESANVVTPDDLVAVALLNVRVRPSVAIQLLVEQSVQLTELLRQIPVDLDLRDADDPLLDAESPLGQAWRLVREGPGDKPADRWVTASKLLARKRPRLVPSYDGVVRQLIHGPRYLWWHPARAATRDPDVWRQLADLHAGTRIPAAVSLLRVLDVVLWMEGSRRGFQNGIAEE